jgi:hypothetical protein
MTELDLRHFACARSNEKTPRMSGTEQWRNDDAFAFWPGRQGDEYHFNGRQFVTFFGMCYR